MLHRLVDAEDPVEDVGAAAAAAAAAASEGGDGGGDEGQEEEGGEGGDEADAPPKGGKAAPPAPRAAVPPPVLVGRPAPSVVRLGAALLDRATGVLSALRVNTNRDAGPLDLALLKAR